MRTFTPECNGAIWQSTEPIEFYGTSLPLMVESESPDVPSPHQLASVAAIERVGERLRADIYQNARDHCRRVEEWVDLEDEGVHINFDRIEDHIHLKSVMVPKLGPCSAAVYMLDYDCDWEPEHGMQMVIEDDEVVFCASCMLYLATEWYELIKLLPAERRRELRRMQKER
jgi:hypothetical protein